MEKDELYIIVVKVHRSILEAGSAAADHHVRAVPI